MDPQPQDGDKWAALYRLIDAHYQSQQSQHGRLREEIGVLKTTIERIGTRFETKYDELGARLEEKMHDDLVTRAEFAPVQKGFYGICALVFTAVVTAVLKLTMKGS